MKLLLFDIDGTLLHTDGLSKDIFFESISETFDVEIHPGNIPWGGLTDRGIAEFALRRAGILQHAIDQKIMQVFDRMDSKWRQRGSHTNFTIFKGATDLVNHCATVDRFSMSVLTANCAQGANHKLRISKFETFFDFVISGEAIAERNYLPGLVFEKTNQAYGYEVDPNDCVIIGDTPADVECARAHGMQVVAVSTGRYSAEELADHRPDLLVNSLAPSHDLLSFLHS